MVYYSAVKRNQLMIYTTRTNLHLQLLINAVIIHGCKHHRMRHAGIMVLPMDDHNTT